MYKPLADSTLMNKTKKEIIEYLRIAEHNYIVLKTAYCNAVNENKCNHCILPTKLEEQEKQIRASLLDGIIYELKNSYNDGTIWNANNMIEYLEQLKGE